MYLWFLNSGDFSFVRSQSSLVTNQFWHHLLITWTHVCIACILEFILSYSLTAFTSPASEELDSTSEGRQCDHTDSLAARLQWWEKRVQHRMYVFPWLWNGTHLSALLSAAPLASVSWSCVRWIAEVFLKWADELWISAPDSWDMLKWQNSFLQ